MRLFLIKVLGFMFMLLLVNMLLGYFLVDKYYGNKMFEKKLSVINTSEENYDFLFFGSSRIATGIDPFVFDSLLKTKNRQVNSFNMATYGTWMNEDFYLIESFIEETGLKNATIFIEFQNVMSIQWGNIASDKNLYYQNYNNYRFIFSYVFSRKINSVRDPFIGLHYLLTYSISETLFSFNLGKSDCFDPTKSAPRDFNERGFNGLSSGNVNIGKIASYQSRSKKLFALTKEDQNKAFLKRIQEVVTNARKRNIAIIFVLTPKNYTAEMASVYKKIPISNRINYSNFLELDELYHRNYWADNSHFNADGAKLYTKFLVTEFLNEPRVSSR